MTGKLNRLSTTCMLLVVIATVSGDVQAATFEKLKLTLSANTVTPLPYEPIEVTITLRNGEKEPILGHKLLNSGYGLLEFMIGREQGEFVGFVSANANAKSVLARSVELAPGEDVEASEVLSYGWIEGDPRRGRYLFDKPGRYELKAVLSGLDHKGRIGSNVLKVTVKPPKGTDVKALALVQENTGRENFLLRTGLPWPSEESEKTIAELVRLVRLYPRSSYAKYASLTLARVFLRGYGHRLSEAPAMFEKVLEHPKSWVTREALFELVAYYLEREKEREKARSRVTELKTAFPGSRSAKTAERLLLIHEQKRQAGK